jgi:hypothetical protein
MPSALFVLFLTPLDRVFCFCPGRLTLPESPLPILPYNWDYRSAPLCPVYLLKWGLSLMFCPSLPWTEILLISAFSIAGTTGVSQHTQLNTSF